jgi:predicted N-acetyltransferase YhbS
MTTHLQTSYNGVMEARVVPAVGDVLEQILDETYPLWNEGLSRENYGRFNLAQRKTPWGAAHLQRVALVSSDGRLLSTAKRYDLRARLDGRPVRVFGIGAVFTPPSLRRRGLAADLIERLLETAAQESYDLALLFSAIGPAYYRRFGFEAIPVEQVSIDVRVRPGSPAMLVRAGDDDDVGFLAEMHEARAAASGWRFALDRDADFIRFAIARKRLLAGFAPPGLRQVEYFVAEEGGRPAAYAVLLRAHDLRILCECGDRDPSGARVGALLQALLARAPAEHARLIRAWLPPGFRPPQVDLLQIEPPAVTMMVRPLHQGTAIDPPLVAEDVMYWLGDVV